MEIAGDVTHVLAAEAEFTKKLYRYAAQNTKQSIDQECVIDEAWQTGFWIMGIIWCNYWRQRLSGNSGIPHGFAVMHGKTRRGALVFDVADLIKDAIVLPMELYLCHERAERQRIQTDLLTEVYRT